MSDITIVTAFADIGRSDWDENKGLPHYLKRTTDTYFERFSYMAELENDIIVYVTPDLVEKVMEIRKDKPITINEFSLSEFQNILDKIKEIQNNDSFKKLISPYQIKNPEYWSPEYVLINWLKSHFVCRSYQNKQIRNPLSAWLDFGYFRSPHNLKKWTYDFDQEKIHIFSIKDLSPHKTLIDIISNNEVYVTGPCIVSGSNGWSILEQSVKQFANKLMDNNLVDDDQTLLLLSYFANKEKYINHKLKETDWFTVVKEFNDYENN